MSHRILITGASGYLGGDLLAQLPAANLPTYEKLYALVGTDTQAEAVKKYGAEPIRINVQDSANVRNAVVRNKITVVYYLIDPVKSEAQVHFINALSEVKKQSGQEVHFLHVSFGK
jgi:nucleoside-diphosphate-sugar epimerase